ncbi:MAG: 6-bladed beta-propeller [Gemmatimonadaceae bacterium]|nr:6-bladed beta-propeller [Gemmatimonadaceae bacterium]
MTRVRCAAWVAWMVIATATAQAQVDSTRAWTFTLEQRYGARAGAELAEPTSLAVDAQGRLYVVDARPVAIKVFTPDGKLLRTIGQQGSGPGEYRGAWIAIRGRYLAVHDAGQSRTTVFDTSGRLLRSWSSACCHHNEIQVDSAYRVVVPAPSRGASQGGAIRRILYVRFSIEGEPIDTLAIEAGGDERLWTVSRADLPQKPADGATSIVIPFTPAQLFALHPQGGAVTGWSGEYRIMRVGGGRSGSAYVTRRWTPRRIPDELRRSRVDSAIAQLTPMIGVANARRVVRLEDVPLLEPAFTRLLVDAEGNTWVRRLLGGSDRQTVFEVFGPHGEFVGRATLPAPLPAWGASPLPRGRSMCESSRRTVRRRSFDSASRDADGTRRGWNDRTRRAARRRQAERTRSAAPRGRALSPCAAS